MTTEDMMSDLVQTVLDKGILALIVLWAGFMSSRRLDEYRRIHDTAQDQAKAEREQRARDEQRRREEQLDDEQRRLVPRIQFEARCEFFGPESGEYVVAVVIVATNKGNVRRKFKSLAVRLRGIRKAEPLAYWKEHGEARLEFPVPLAKEELVPPDDYYYVEPGLQQTFTLPTKIPADISYVLLHVEARAIAERREDPEDVVYTEERLIAVAASPASPSGLEPA